MVDRATAIVGNAFPGGVLGLLVHGSFGLASGALISAALWPSVKAFLINVTEWVLRGIQRRLGIPFVAPTPYPMLVETRALHEPDPWVKETAAVELTVPQIPSSVA
jgi:hypothetical protein